MACKSDQQLRRSEARCESRLYPRRGFRFRCCARDDEGTARDRRKTCTSTSRRTATASSTIPSTPSWRRGRSAGSPRATPGGNVNLAPYSFFNAFCYVPPIIGFSSTNWKDSVANIQETGEFVWNLATMDLAKHMNATAAHVGPRGRRVQARRADRRRPASSSTYRAWPRARLPFECKVSRHHPASRAPTARRPRPG